MLDHPQSLLPLPDGVSPEYLRFHRVCPAAINDSGAVELLAATDAILEDALPELALAFGRDVVTVPADWEQIEQRLAAYGTSEFLTRDSDDEHADLRDLASQAPVIRYVNTVIRDAVDAGASDIHIEATRDGSTVRFRVDGRLAFRAAPPADLRHAVVSRIKLLADMDIAERRRPQDGRLRVRLENRELDVRAATIPTLHGESVVLRLLEQNGRPTTLPELGMPTGMEQSFATLIARPNGLVLVSGPTGSGKTTTLYAALQRRDLKTEKVLTVEDPVEYQLRDVAQVPVHRAAGVSFAGALRAILRQDPDVVMLGEMRDAETAAVAFQAAMTGHLVLSTVHTNDAVSAITRLIDLEVAPYLVSAALSGVLAQRLVRRNCFHCSAWHPVSASHVSWLTRGVGELRRVKRGAGCNACHGSGFASRVGLFELLIVDDSVRRSLSTDEGRMALPQVMKAAGMRDMRHDGFTKVESGLTTPEEIARALVI